MKTRCLRTSADRARRAERVRRQPGTSFIGSVTRMVMPVLFFHFTARNALSAPNSIPCHTQSCLVESGLHDGTSNQTSVAFQQIIRTPGAPWLRLHISDCHLGRQSYVVLTSLLDGSEQRLDGASLAQSENWTAYFNGEAVRVELHVVPGDQSVFLRTDNITVGERLGAEDERDPTLTAAAADDCRNSWQNSADPRVGRIVHPTATGTVFCTAWLASNGSLVTAGHCADMDPDEGGPGLPDGVLDFSAATIVEFNVPASLPDGTPVFANSLDQYPIVPASVVWSFPGNVASLVGGDWAVFACGANSTTRLGPHLAQRAFFRLTNQSPVPDVEEVRLTGYAVNSTPPGSSGGGNVRNLTQQTDLNWYAGEVGVLPPGLPLPISDYHLYALAFRSGSDGSPVIWNGTFAIGIHLWGGCIGRADWPIGGATGIATSLEHDPLEFALQNFPGPNTWYVDAASYPQFVIPIKNGTVFYPYDKFGDAVNAATPGATISIVAGTYNEQLTISKPVTLTAPVGGVTIGQ